MDKRTRSERALLAATSADYGVVIEPIGGKRGNHTRYLLRYGNRTRKFICSVSPSDHRASKNKLASFKRICRELTEEK